MADALGSPGLSPSRLRLFAIVAFVVFLVGVAALYYVLLKPQPLQVGATGNPRSGPTPLTVSFVASASGGSGALRFFWEFGDGSTSSDANPSHTYAFPGMYNATLQVSDIRESRSSPAILITSTTTRFDFRDNLTAAKPDAFVRGLITSAFVVEGRGDVSTFCSVSVSNSSVYQGDCASFAYVYKTKRSAEVEARFEVNVSVHRNATDARVSITLTGELLLAYQTTFDVHEVIAGVITDAKLDVAGQVGGASQQSYQVSLSAGASKTYVLQVNGELWANISANETIKYKIEEETTTLIQGDCRQVSAFTWVKGSETFQVRVKITITYVTADPTSSVAVSLDLSGSFQVVAS